MGLYQKDFAWKEELGRAAVLVIYIEPLAQSIRQHLLIPGVEINAIEHKISLFADNVMIYSAGPKKHFTNLMQVLEKCNEYAGCKLNVTKTQILMFNCKPSTELKQNYDIKWDAKRLKYLGVLTKDLTKLYRANYDLITNNIKSDIETTH